MDCNYTLCNTNTYSAFCNLDLLEEINFYLFNRFNCDLNELRPLVVQIYKYTEISNFCLVFYIEFNFF